MKSWSDKIKGSRVYTDNRGVWISAGRNCGSGTVKLSALMIFNAHARNCPKRRRRQHAISTIWLANPERNRGGSWQRWIHSTGDQIRIRIVYEYICLNYGILLRVYLTCKRDRDSGFPSDVANSLTTSLSIEKTQGRKAPLRRDLRAIHSSSPGDIAIRTFVIMRQIENIKERENESVKLA